MTKFNNRFIFSIKILVENESQGTGRGRGLNDSVYTAIEIYYFFLDLLIIS